MMGPSSRPTKLWRGPAQRSPARNAQPLLRGIQYPKSQSWMRISIVHSKDHGETLTSSFP